MKIFFDTSVYVAEALLLCSLTKMFVAPFLETEVANWM